MADWAAIIGPALAAVTVPRRLSGGTLTLACAGPVALELQHLAGQVLERINAHMGKRVVERLRFVQDGAAPRPTPPPQPPPVPVAVDLPGIPPGPLHDALHALAQRIGNDKGA